MIFSIEEYLEAHATTTEWDLRGKQLTRLDGVKVAAALATNSTLTKLNLYGECGYGLCDVGCVECVKEEG